MDARRFPNVRCAVGAVLASMSLLALSPSAAFAHAYFEGSTPAPGTRTSSPPGEVLMRFDETLNPRLSTAAIYQTPSGRHLAASVSFPQALQMAVRPARPLPRGSYRVEWHSVSADDGHELEGSFTFGVQADALGGATTTVAGHLDGLGWLRVLLRAALYPALFLFAGPLMLRTLLGGGDRDLWLLPGGTRRLLGSDQAAALTRTERSFVLDAGITAIALAAGVVLVETQIAAGSLSPSAIHGFLLTNTTGLARVGLLVLLAVALAGAVMAPRYGGIAAAAALGELALSGHADSASPRALAVAVDWVHLLAGALWLGGIAVIAWIWVRRLRDAVPELRRSVLTELLPRFGRVALPAFLVVASTGILDAYIQLRHPGLLWESSYGRTLLVKSGLVGVIALISYTHVFRLRPPSRCWWRSRFRARPPPPGRSPRNQSLRATRVCCHCRPLISSRSRPMPAHRSSPAGSITEAEASRDRYGSSTSTAGPRQSRLRSKVPQPSRRRAVRPVGRSRSTASRPPCTWF